MPAKAKKKGSYRAHGAKSNARPHKKNAGTRVIVMGPRSNKKGGHSHRGKHRKNPAFFGVQATPAKMAEFIAGGLIGLTINRAVLPMLPAKITGNNVFATLAAFAVALGEWWLFSLLPTGKDFASAVGFGGLMSAGSTALNNFIPSVGSTISLQGGRGVGDLVTSQPGLPFWPSGQLMGAGMQQVQYNGMESAYPPAY